MGKLDMESVKEGLDLTMELAEEINFVASIVQVAIQRILQKHRNDSRTKKVVSNLEEFSQRANELKEKVERGEVADAKGLRACLNEHERIANDLQKLSSDGCLSFLKAKRNERKIQALFDDMVLNELKMNKFIGTSVFIFAGKQARRIQAEKASSKEVREQISNMLREIEEIKLQQAKLEEKKKEKEEQQKREHEARHQEAPRQKFPVFGSVGGPMNFRAPPSGRRNAWNDFQKANGGKGWTKAKMSREYAKNKR